MDSDERGWISLLLSQELIVGQRGSHNNGISDCRTVCTRARACAINSLVARGEELDAVDVWALSWSRGADLRGEVYRVGDLRESAGNAKGAVGTQCSITHPCSCRAEGRRSIVSAPLTSVPTRIRSRHGG
jgi:hypothetical protein